MAAGREGKMFFKLSMLKKMFKDAYKSGGFVVGRTPAGEVKDGYYISSGWWVMWFAQKRIPKEVKATIIELSGELPEAGEVFRSIKGMGNQYEVEQKELYDLPAVYRMYRCSFCVRRLLIEKDGIVLRVIQEGDTGNVLTVSETVMNLISRDAVDYENGEYEPVGPLGTGPDTKCLMWGNETCYFLTGIYDISQDGEYGEFLRFLKATEII